MFDREIQTILGLAKQQGLTDVEVYAKRDTGLSLKAQKGELESFQRSDSVGIGVRVLYGQREGYAYTENLSESSLARALREAAANAELVEAEPGVKLPDEEPLGTNLPALYNPLLDEVPLEAKVAMALDLEKAALATDKRIRTVPYSSYSDGASMVRIANTHGVDRQYRSNAAFAFSYPIATEGDENKVYFVVKPTRNFAELSASEVGTAAARGAVHRLGSQEIKSGRYRVVFAPRAMAELLSTFSVVFSAKAAQEGKSLLNGKQGQAIAAPHVVLIDDPLLPAGFASRPFDDEGVPSRTLTLIDDGVFRSFLHNTQTAERAKTKSTGHASRGGYKGTIDVAPSNFYLRPGDLSAEAIVKADGPVVLIDDLQGMHAGTNAISGDFSLAAQGYLYENGEKKHPVHNFTVAGNFLTLLREVEALGADLQFFPQGAYVGTPSVRVKELAIAGA
ncbi:MAG TPA: TldD/PmbA family protein [Oscillatoriaceae cyanobacterium]